MQSKFDSRRYISSIQNARKFFENNLKPISVKTLESLCQKMDFSIPCFQYETAFFQKGIGIHIS